MSRRLASQKLVRGPAEHLVRDEIIDAARRNFARDGYAHTTVSDLAREIGYSKSYIYRFFISKQAIGEEICGECLGTILRSVRQKGGEGRTASQQFRDLFESLSNALANIFFQEHKIFEMMTLAAEERWSVTLRFNRALAILVRAVIAKGRESGEFESETPLQTTPEAILLTMAPFIDPLQIAQTIAYLPRGRIELENLILRSLAPS